MKIRKEIHKQTTLNVKQIILYSILLIIFIAISLNYSPIKFYEHTYDFFISYNHHVLCWINFRSYLWSEENKFSPKKSHIKEIYFRDKAIFHSLVDGCKVILIVLYS